MIQRNANKRPSLLYFKYLIQTHLVFFIINTTIIVFTASHFQAAVFHSGLPVQLAWGTEWTSLQPSTVEDTVTHSFVNVKWDFWVPGIFPFLFSTSGRQTRTGFVSFGPYLGRV